MDVSNHLAEHAAKHATEVLPRSTPVEVDAALLAAFDYTPVDPELYTDRESHLLALTLTSTHSLLSNLFLLPRLPSSSSSGPTAILPLPTTLLPREKPLPKPKPPTKWERFAKEKGISHKKREKREWDEEKGEWVNRWGRNGKNREGEDQWLHEVKASEDADHDPGRTIKSERKARIAKNASQHQANLSRAAASSTSTSNPSSTLLSKSISSENASNKAIRRADLERSLLISKTSTASLGKFDKKIEGEPKIKGQKRKFETNEIDFKDEKGKAMDILKRVERGEGKKIKKGGEGKEGGVNARKAVRYEGRMQRAAAKRK